MYRAVDPDAFVVFCTLTSVTTQQTETVVDNARFFTTLARLKRVFLLAPVKVAKGVGTFLGFGCFHLVELLWYCLEVWVVLVWEVYPGTGDHLFLLLLLLLHRRRTRSRSKRGACSRGRSRCRSKRRAGGRGRRLRGVGGHGNRWLKNAGKIHMHRGQQLDHVRVTVLTVISFVDLYKMAVAIVVDVDITISSMRRVLTLVAIFAAIQTTFLVLVS